MGGWQSNESHSDSTGWGILVENHIPVIPQQISSESYQPELGSSALFQAPSLQGLPSPQDAAAPKVNTLGLLIRRGQRGEGLGVGCKPMEPATQDLSVLGTGRLCLSPGVYLISQPFIHRAHRSGLVSTSASREVPRPLLLTALSVFDHPAV